jgi:hypothetical protein
MVCETERFESTNTEEMSVLKQKEELLTVNVILI